MRVVIAARTQGPLEETCAQLQAAGARAMWRQTDVSKEADCEHMNSETVKAFGRVDVLVNNAGIAGTTKLTPDMTLAEWQEVLDINITGAWLAARAAIPVMVKQGGGDILMISSGAGRRGFPLRTPYAASKWAMIGLTQTLALEWGMKKIRVNCICPGATEGPRIERVIQARAEAINPPYETAKPAYTPPSRPQRIV